MLIGIALRNFLYSFIIQNDDDGDDEIDDQNQDSTTPDNDSIELNADNEPGDDTPMEPKSTKKPIVKQGQAGKPLTKRQKLEAEENTLIKKAIDIMDKATATADQKEDGFEFFGRYVASELRTIPSSRAQQWAKLQIQNILYSAQAEPGIQPQAAYSMASFDRHFSPARNDLESFHRHVSPSPSGSDWTSHHSHSPLPEHSGSASYTNY